MTESSSPIVGQDITSDQWYGSLAGQGNGVIGDWGYPYALTLNDSDQTATIGVASSTGQARAIVAGYRHLLTAATKVSLPTVSSTTTYHIGLLFDGANAAAAGGPVKLTVLTGPVNTTGSQVWLELYTVTRTASGALSASAVIRTWPFLAPGVNMDTDADILASDPLRFLQGTVATSRDNGQQFVATGPATSAHWDRIGYAFANHTNRAAGSVAFNPGTMTYLVSTTIPNAPVGLYIAYGRAVLYANSTANNGYIRISAVSSSQPTPGNPVPDSQIRLTTDIGDHAVQGLIDHLGGDLTITVSAQGTTGQTTVIGNGTYAGAFRVGS